METFTKLESEDLGIMFRCLKCQNIFNAIEKEDHTCKSSEEIASENEEKEIVALLDGSVHGLKKYIEIRKLQFDGFVSRMEAKFPPNKIRPVVMSIIQERLVWVGKSREKCYQDYTELRKNGISYSERRKTLDIKKITRCDEEEARLVALSKSFKVKKWSEFLKDGDQGSIRRLGLRGFISLFFEDFIW
jgi:hypothetical protein